MVSYLRSSPAASDILLNINSKRRQETYTDAVHGNIKKDTRKTDHVHR